MLLVTTCCLLLLARGGCVGLGIYSCLHPAAQVLVLGCDITHSYCIRAYDNRHLFPCVTGCRILAQLPSEPRIVVGPDERPRRIVEPCIMSGKRACHHQVYPSLCRSFVSQASCAIYGPPDNSSLDPFQTPETPRAWTPSSVSWLRLGRPVTDMKTEVVRKQL